MNPRSLRSALLPLVAGLVQILSGCMSSTVNDPDKSAGGSDEIDTRVAVDRTGRPVAAARIALVRTDDSTGKALAVNATGTDGSFPKFVVPDGYYSVVLRDPGDSLGKYVDSVQVKNQKVPAGRDTLLALGSVSGVVRVSAGHSPVTVSMGLVGTDILATVKTDGTFRIELVPGGIYTLGAFPMMDGYGPLYLRLQVKNGQNLTLPDTLVMPFTGLPAPGALRLLQDTATGNVRLSWSPVDHPDLLGYVVDRVEGGAVTTSRYLRDTAWTDSLGAYWASQPLLGPWPSREVAYRVRSRSMSGSPDSKNAADTITADAPEWTKRVDSTQPILSQDTSTGDVRIRWKPVRHPHLKGYVVERLENGVTISQRMQRDPSLVDSIGQDWNALPLLGPWPQRSLSYRIRLVADSVATDAVTASVAFLAKPPEWTKHVDSVKVTMQTDSVTGVAAFRWNTPIHPDLAGWSVVRTMDGISDCRSEKETGSWSDSNCPEVRSRVLDSSVSDGAVSRFLQLRAPLLEYAIQAIRKNGSREIVARESWKVSQVSSLVTWRDSLAPDLTNDTRIESFGGWLLKRDWAYPSMWESFLSRDGLAWERIPHSFDDAIGFEDSLWTISLEKDSIHVQLSQRIGVGMWTTRNLKLPNKAGWIQSSSLERSNVVIAYHPANRQPFSDTILKITSDSSFAPSQIAGVGPNSKPMTNYGSFPLSESLRIDDLQGADLSLVSVVLDGKVISSRSLYTARKVYGTLIGPVGGVGGMAVAYARGETLPKLAYFPRKGDAILMPFPDWVTGECSAVVFQDEIWCFKSGHIWKGKLNLPFLANLEKP